MPGKLSTHVLDLTTGRPAPGLRIELHRHVAGAAPQLIKSTVTNADGAAHTITFAGLTTGLPASCASGRARSSSIGVEGSATRATLVPGATC